MWYCDQFETAAACAVCPSATSASSSSASSCQPSFNAIVLLPLLAVPGAFIPPPPGLSTLAIGPSGSVEDYNPTSTSDESSQSSTSSNFSLPAPACAFPSLQARLYASSSLITLTPPVSPAPPPSSVSIDATLAPILPLTSAADIDPSPSGLGSLLPTPSATAAIFCNSAGPFYEGLHDPYYPDGFYQVCILVQKATDYSSDDKLTRSNRMANHSLAPRVCKRSGTYAKSSPIDNLCLAIAQTWSTPYSCRLLSMDTISWSEHHMMLTTAGRATPVEIV